MKRIHWIWLLIFLGGIFLLEVNSIRHKTFTADEEDHYGYGWNILMLNADSRIEGNGTLMPFNSMNALPRLIGRHLSTGRLHDFLTDMMTGRLITMLFSLLLAFYVFKWSMELYGIHAGYFSLLLFAFSPNIIAHSRLITNDIFATCLMTISLYYFWRFITWGGWKRAAVAATLVGISQVAKYSCVGLYPMMVGIIMVRYGPDLVTELREKDIKSLTRIASVFLKYALFFAAVSLLIINAGFLFNRTFTPLEDYTFESNFWQNIQSQAGVLARIPLPLPVPYLEGPDSRQWESETGEHGNAYLFGETRNPGCFTGYYFWAYLYKVPIAIQLFLLLSIFVYIINFRKYNFSRNEAFLWIPIILFSVYINFFPGIQSGLRYSLPIFPLLLIFTGSLLKNWLDFRLLSKLGISVLAIYLIVSVLSYFPHYLSYFNELVWDRRQAYKILSDSNLRWGQNRWYLRQYLDSHPEAILFPRGPRAGRLVVGAGRLVGIFHPEEYRWLRDNFEPVDHVAYSFLVYEISQEELDTIPRDKKGLKK
ncbi:MAG: glycosyltransferase family 39 protein [Candidatus Euphemobacter frigidus]|nr:glycosyltransferase family 39 protein [Candidatus Euphemobacter frigidus]MDP8276608.1 glycosyltransferase family 39 protein [Candidatus Euphemobacter frigidus]